MKLYCVTSLYYYNKILKCHFPSIKKVKKSWYLSSTCHWLGFAGPLFYRFLLLGVAWIRGKFIYFRFSCDQVVQDRLFIYLFIYFYPFGCQISCASLLQVYVVQLCFYKVDLLFSFWCCRGFGFEFQNFVFVSNGWKWCCPVVFFFFLFFQHIFWCQCYNTKFWGCFVLILVSWACLLEAC